LGAAPLGPVAREALPAWAVANSVVEAEVSVAVEGAAAEVAGDSGGDLRKRK